MKDITYIIDITAGQPERMHINRDSRTAYFFLSAFDVERMQEMKEQADAYILRGLLRAVKPSEREQND